MATHSFMSIDWQFAQKLKHLAPKFAYAAIFGTTDGVLYKFEQDHNGYRLLLPIRGNAGKFREQLVAQLKLEGVELKPKQVVTTDDLVEINFGLIFLRKTLESRGMKVFEAAAGLIRASALSPSASCSFCGAIGSDVVLKKRIPVFACDACIAQQRQIHDQKLPEPDITIGLTFDQFERERQAARRQRVWFNGIGIGALFLVMFSFQYFLAIYPEDNLIDHGRWSYSLLVIWGLLSIIGWALLHNKEKAIKWFLERSGGMQSRKVVRTFKWIMPPIFAFTLSLGLMGLELYINCKFDRSQPALWKVRVVGEPRAVKQEFAPTHWWRITVQDVAASQPRKRPVHLIYEPDGQRFHAGQTLNLHVSAGLLGIRWISGATQ